MPGNDVGNASAHDFTGIFFGVDSENNVETRSPFSVSGISLPKDL